jgi:hypothetical protein
MRISAQNQLNSYRSTSLLNLNLGEAGVQLVHNERHLVAELELLKLRHAIIANTNTRRLRISRAKHQTEARPNDVREKKMRKKKKKKKKLNARLARLQIRDRKRPQETRIS